MTFAKNIEEGQLILSGLNNHAESAAKRGIGAEFIAQLKTVLEEIRAIENTRKLTKAEHMESTALLNSKLKEYAQIKSEAKKVIKLEFPKETWRAFGIVDDH